MRPGDSRLREGSKWIRRWGAMVVEMDLILGFCSAFLDSLDEEILTPLAEAAASVIDFSLFNSC